MCIRDSYITHFVRFEVFFEEYVEWRKEMQALMEIKEQELINKNKSEEKDWKDRRRAKYEKLKAEFEGEK